MTCISRITVVELCALLFTIFSPGEAQAGGLVNRTIDDNIGDSFTGAIPVYFPVDQWQLGETCAECRVNTRIVDASRTFDGTWHDSTYHPGQPDSVITIFFTGVAVYVFNLITNQVDPDTASFTNLTFSIDNVLVGQYIRFPDNTTDILYQVPVFSHTGLENFPHVLEIRASGTSDSLTLFDYVLYTAEDNTASTPESTPATTTPIPDKSRSTILSSTAHLSPPSSVLGSSTSAPSTSSFPTSSTSQAHEPSSTNTSDMPSYTTGSLSHSSKLRVGAIAGGAIGGLAVLALLSAILFCTMRKRHKSLSPKTPGPLFPMSPQYNLDQPLVESRRSCESSHNQILDTFLKQGPV